MCGAVILNPFFCLLRPADGAREASILHRLVLFPFRKIGQTPPCCTPTCNGLGVHGPDAGAIVHPYLAGQRKVAIGPLALALKSLALPYPIGYD